MLERMQRLQKPLSHVLADSTDTESVSGIEWSQINCLLKVMKPLYDATQISCGVKYPTLSMVKPLLFGITNGLNSIEFDYDDASEMGREFIDNILNGLDVRFCEVDRDIIFKKSTYLDPRYKNYFYKEEEVKEIEDDIKLEIMRFLMPDNDSHELNVLTREHSGNQYSGFWSFMKRPTINAREKNLETLRNEILQEMVVYLNCGLINPQQDPLIWWRQEKNKYPRLSLMARRYLGVPCISAESERLFSTAGDIRRYGGTQQLVNSTSPLKMHPPWRDAVVLDGTVFTANCQCGSSAEHKRMFPHYRTTVENGATKSDWRVTVEAAKTGVTAQRGHHIRTAQSMLVRDMVRGSLAEQGGATPQEEVRGHENRPATGTG
nr:zinc finger BED domain-containing protein 4-like [Neodiprion pinetum]